MRWLLDVERFGNRAWLLTGMIAIVPVVQSARLAWTNHRAYVKDDATNWIEQHVPPGTRVYLESPWESRPPLPTAEASLAMWSEVTDSRAWQRKFERGLSYYNADRPMAIPRAMSEENLVLDRCLFRRWFILGSEARSTRPRYDIRVSLISHIFGVQDPVGELKRTGGVVVWRSKTPPEGLGEPVVRWVNARGEGTRIYAVGHVVGQLAAPTTRAAATTRAAD